MAWAAIAPFEQWLSLLSALKITTVSGVLSRIKLYQLDMKSVLTCRTSEKLSRSDILQLAEVLAKLSDNWRLSNVHDSHKNKLADQLMHLVYSLPLSDSVLKKILSIKDNEVGLEKVLTMWIQGEFIRPPTLTNLKIILHSDVVGLKVEAYKLREKVESSASQEYISSIALQSILRDGNICLHHIQFFRKVLHNCRHRWKNIAFFLFLPDTVATKLMSIVCDKTPVRCLREVLIMWERNEFPNARCPSLKKYLKAMRYIRSILK